MPEGVPQQSGTVIFFLQPNRKWLDQGVGTGTPPPPVFQDPDRRGGGGRDWRPGIGNTVALGIIIATGALGIPFYLYDDSRIFAWAIWLAGATGAWVAHMRLGDGNK